MGEICYLVFIEDSIMIAAGYNFELPERYQNYPYLKASDDGFEVRLTDDARKESVRDLMRSCLKDQIECLSKYGPVRLDFPCWYVMIAYPVKSEAAREGYWDFDQIIESFLSLRGPEFII